MKQRVNAARDVQNRRFGSGGMQRPNGAGRNAPLLHTHEECAELMKARLKPRGLTARSYDRILKVARTVADLDGSEDIQLPSTSPKRFSTGRSIWEIDKQEKRK